MPAYRLSVYNGEILTPLAKESKQFRSSDIRQTFLSGADFNFSTGYCSCRESLISYMNTFTKAYNGIQPNINGYIHYEIDIIACKPDLTEEQQGKLNDYFGTFQGSNPERVIVGPNKICGRFFHLDQIFISFILWVLTDANLVEYAIKGDTVKLIDYIVDDYANDHNRPRRYTARKLPDNPLTTPEEFMYGFYLSYCFNYEIPARDDYGYTNGPGTYGMKLAESNVGIFIRFIWNHKKAAKYVAGVMADHDYSNAWTYILISEANKIKTEESKNA